MPPHPLPNLETQKFYLNEPKFNGVYSRDNSLDKIKNEVYVINLDEYADIGTHYIALYALNNDLTYFESFGIEHIPKEMKRNLIALSAAVSGVSIASFPRVVGTPVGIASASFSFVLLLTTGIVKKLLQTTQNKEKKRKLSNLSNKKQMNH